MSQIFEWPTILRPKRAMFKIMPQSIRGPAAMSGRRQTVVSDAGFWHAELSDFPIYDPDQVREWRGVIAALQGAANELIIGPFDRRQVPDVVSSAPEYALTPHSDGGPFSDKSLYSQNLSVELSVVNDVGRRATKLRLSGKNLSLLRRGHYFSIIDGTGRPRLYIITTPPTTVSSTLSDVNFLPPARMPIYAGSYVEFGSPRATMVLADDSTADLDINHDLTTQGSLSLDEAWEGIN